MITDTELPNETNSLHSPTAQDDQQDEEAVKAVVLEAWKYRNPEDICDGLTAESARVARVPEQKARERKDRYYTQSRSIYIKGVVKMAKLGRLHNVP